MVIKVDNIKEKKRNYFMTSDEAKILWKYSKRWGSKFQVMIGLALFRGMRISEICAVNLYDFQDQNFQKLNIILSKSHISDNFPILKEFNELLHNYIMRNKHMFKDGYIFPFYNSRKKANHMSEKTAGALFCKLRKIIGKDYPEFLERIQDKAKGDSVNRYRIGWHSCRRFFETKLYDKYKDVRIVANIMRYRDWKTVQVYVDPYEIWKKEQELLNDTFGDFFQDLNQVGMGQTKLTSF